MSTDANDADGSTILALLAYQNLCLAESILCRGGDGLELAERVPVGQLSAQTLRRFTRMCDAIPAGQQAVINAMGPIASPIDEFWAVTAPRGRGEQMVRLLLVCALELEVVSRVHPGQLGAPATEALASDAGLWRSIDHASGVVLEALKANRRAVDHLSAYARRVLGEISVAWQRLIVRAPGIRLALTGQADPELTATTAVLDELLGAVATRLGQLGLAV